MTEQIVGAAPNGWAVLNRGGHVLMHTIRGLRTEAIDAALRQLREGQQPRASGWRRARARYGLRVERVTVRVWGGW